MPLYGFLKRLSLENDKKRAENGLLVRKHPSLELPPGDRSTSYDFLGISEEGSVLRATKTSRKQAG